MKKLIVSGVALLLLLSACSTPEKEQEGDLQGAGDGEASSEGAEGAETTDGAAEEEVVVNRTVYDLTVEVPSGFAENSEATPDVEFTDDYNVQTFEMADSEGLDKIQIVSYLLPESADTSTLSLQQELSSSFDKQTGNITTAGKFDGAIINGQSAMYRYGNIPYEDDELKQRNYYAYSETQLVYVTCQWFEFYEQVERACPEVLTNISFTDEWVDPLAAAPSDSELSLTS